MIKKLFRGENTYNFYGRRRIGFIASSILALVSVGSLVFGGLNLGIDFRGGVAFEVPTKGEMSVATARDVLNAENVPASGVKIQTLTSATEERVRIQLGDQTPEVVDALKSAFAAKAGVDSSEISVDKVSSSWGRSVTIKAVQALLVFFVIVSIFIAWRFEWPMAVGAFASVIHDIVLSVGVYSLLQIEVTPATVTAFLTIMGYSLYDTIVIFDKMSENEKKFSATRASYGDVINVSMNAVLMRSINTSMSSILPVASLLLLGAGILGARALSEFAVALFIGMLFGAYSSIYIAAPVVGLLKERSSHFRPTKGQISIGAEMAHLIASGAPVGRRAHNRAQSAQDTAAGVVESVGSVDAILSHPPRPRKKSRR